jgi:hypothetical protein
VARFLLILVYFAHFTSENLAWRLQEKNIVLTRRLGSVIPRKVHWRGKTMSLLGVSVDPGAITAPTYQSLLARVVLALSMALGVAFVLVAAE